MAGKQAKVISEEFLQEALAYVERHTQHPLRNRVMLLLSHKAGLRAKEIGALQWTR
jgi:integrase/recombinase XerD